MGNKKYTESEVIEPEIIDENGNNISNKHTVREEEVKQQLNPLRQIVMGVLGAAVAIISGIMMFIVFVVVFVLAAIPMLILSLFGKKPNIKIFKYKM